MYFYMFFSLEAKKSSNNMYYHISLGNVSTKSSKTFKAELSHYTVRIVITLDTAIASLLT